MSRKKKPRRGYPKLTSRVVLNTSLSALLHPPGNPHSTALIRKHEKASRKRIAKAAKRLANAYGLTPFDLVASDEGRRARSMSVGEMERAVECAARVLSTGQDASAPGRFGSPLWQCQRIGSRLTAANERQQIRKGMDWIDRLELLLGLDFFDHPDRPLD